MFLYRIWSGTMWDFITQNIIFFNLISTCISLGVILYFIFRGRKSRLLYSFILFQIIIFIYFLCSMVDSLRWLYPQLAGSSVIIRYIYFIYFLIYYDLTDCMPTVLVFCLLSFSWLIFCMHYTCSRLVENKKVMSALVLSVLLVCTIFLTNRYHHMFMDESAVFKRYGPFFFVYKSIVYTYLIFGTFLLLKYSFSQFGRVKKQSIFLIIAILIPVSVSLKLDINYFIFSNSYEYYNKSYYLYFISLSITTMIIAVVTFRYKFSDIMPVALRELVDSMNQLIVAVDRFNKIVDFNRPFHKKFLNGFRLKKEGDIGLLAQYLTDKLGNECDIEELNKALVNNKAVLYNREFDFRKLDGKVYSVSIQPLLRNKVEMIGRVISFNDITEYKSLVEALAVSRERERLARNIHDTLGQTLTILATMLQVSSRQCRDEPDEVSSSIEKMQSIVKDGLSEIRRSASGLIPERLEKYNLKDALKKMVAEFESSGIKVDFSFDEECSGLEYEYSAVIYRITQEALTNSLRHGNAKRVNLIVKYQGRSIRLLITDDGGGCLEIEKGMGLSGMEQRVKSVNGIIQYGSLDGAGFSIFVEVPVVTPEYAV